MAIDYKKLTEDLIKAKIAALEAAKGEDGGTANLDCLTIKIKGVNEAKVVEAGKAAGLSLRKREWIGPRFFIFPPGSGQGNARVRQVRAMEKVMEEAGWETLTYEQID